MSEMPKFTPTDFIAVVNETLEYAYNSAVIVGEVASFKVNQGKWVFFDIKDEKSSISCFMTLWDLRIPIEDGMKVMVRGVPKITKWGKFSFTVQAVQPVGEGSLKKAFEILKKKLGDEGLFDPSKKRGIPSDLSKLGVISSTQAAGYADFIKIINARWGGMKIQVAHTQVHGLEAPDQIIRALKYFNERSEVQMIAILRGGGSADDLACFNDEALVRAIAASKIPVIAGIGHEVDESLSDLAADVRASTPSNAAEMLVPDRNEVKTSIGIKIKSLYKMFSERLITLKRNGYDKVGQITKVINLKITEYQKQILSRIKVLDAMNPERVLRQGYAMLKGELSPGNMLEITTYKQKINAEIKEIYERKEDN